MLSKLRSLLSKLTGSQLFRNASFLTIANLIGNVMGFTQGILVARWLGPENYGVIGLIYAFPSLIFTAFDAGSDKVSVRYLSLFDNAGQNKKAMAVCRLSYGVDFAIALVTLAVVAFLSQWAARTFVKDVVYTSLIVLYAAAFVPRSLTKTSRAIFTAVEDFSTLAKINAFLLVFQSLLTISAVWYSRTVYSAVAATVIALTIQGIILMLLAHRQMVRRWKMSWLSWQTNLLTTTERREILRFLLYNNVDLLANLSAKNLDQLVLGYFRDSVAVGYYRLAFSLSRVVENVNTPLQSVVYPRLSKIAAGDSRQLQSTLHYYARYIGLPLGCLSALSIVVLPFVLPLAAGESFTGAILLTQFFFLHQSVYLALFWVRPFILATDQLKLWLKLGVVSSIFALIGYPIATHFIGSIGTAFVRSISTIGRYLFIAARRINYKYETGYL